MSDNPTIDTYLDAAVARLMKLYGLKRCSDRELARRMNLSNASVSAWRTKRAFPDDATMQRLAELADLNVPEALAWLGVWRNDGAVAATYETMARRLGRTAAAFFCPALALGALLAGAVAAATVVNPLPARADVHGTLPGHSVTQSGPMYIMENNRRRRPGDVFRNWIKRLTPFLAAAALAACAAQPTPELTGPFSAAEAVPASRAGALPASSAPWTEAVFRLRNRAVPNGLGGEACSAVLVAADPAGGILLTSAHCLRGAAAADLAWAPAGGAWRPVAAILADGGHRAHAVDAVTVRRDWALLAVAAPEATALPLLDLAAPALRAEIARGGRLALAGFGPHRLLVRGDCPLRPAWGTAFLLLGCASGPGDSGGAVVLLRPDGTAALVGIVAGFAGGATLAATARSFAPAITEAYAPITRL